MTDIDRRPAKLEIGRVFNDTFAVIRHRPLLLLIPAILLAIPGAMLNYANGQVRAGAYWSWRRGFNYAVQTHGGGAAMPPFNPALLLVWPILLVLGAGVLASQIVIAVGDLEGRRPDLDEIVGASVRKILPLIGVLILWVLGVSFAGLLLFVPGVMLGLAWFVTLPAVVSERIGVFAAFTRSRALTRGNRWRLFGLLVLLWLILLVIEGVLFGLLGGATGAGGGAMSVVLVVISLLSAVGNVFFYVALAAVYVQLRNSHGGGAAAVVAGVFD